MDPKLYCVCILASHRNAVLQVGASSQRVQRIWQHETGAIAGFTSTYRVRRLVWFEVHCDARAMVTRERLIKERQRAWKVTLIEPTNPHWHDLYAGLLGATPSPAPDPP